MVKTYFLFICCYGDIPAEICNMSTEQILLLIQRIYMLHVNTVAILIYYTQIDFFLL